MTVLEFPQYDPKTAAGLVGSATAAGGLARFLAIEHIDVGPGRLHARVEVRDDLLTPFDVENAGRLVCAAQGTVLVVAAKPPPQERT